jgi:hypothetical protein
MLSSRDCAARDKPGARSLSAAWPTFGAVCGTLEGISRSSSPLKPPKSHQARRQRREAPDKKAGHVQKAGRRATASAARVDDDACQDFHGLHDAMTRCHCHMLLEEVADSLCRRRVRNRPGCKQRCRNVGVLSIMFVWQLRRLGLWCCCAVRKHSAVIKAGCAVRRCGLGS